MAPAMRVRWFIPRTFAPLDVIGLFMGAIFGTLNDLTDKGGI